MIQNQEKFYSVLAIANIDETTIKEAETLFRVYKERSVITAGYFTDDVWALSDEYANYRFDFRISKDDYDKYEEYLKFSMEDFKTYLKTYIMCQMGILALNSMREIIHGVKAVLKCQIHEITSMADTCKQGFMNHVAEFFSMLPPDGREDKIQTILEQLDIVDEVIRSNSNSSQRTLAAFESYFRFGELLDRFWKESDDESEKLFYFPVWLWWHVTGILPMRPREFVLTPRHCLYEVDGKYYLSIVRNKIKGSGKTKEYSIDKDYRRYKYEIPKDLAMEIRWYQEKTKDYVGTALNTLFIADPHYAKWDRCRPYTSRYFTYVNLCTCLRYFFEQIVQDRYGYDIIYERDTAVLPNEKSINYLHLGDTRHIALINLIAEGATPTVAMLLAGHDDPDMTSFYFSNLSTLIECKTYRQYKKQIKGKQTYALSKPVSSLHVGEFILLEDNSRCYSALVRQEDFSECKKACGPAGEIGDCDYCTYHREKGERFADGSDKYVARIESECKTLQNIIAIVRNSKGKTEDLYQTLMRLKETEYSYQQYLMERLKEDGKKENFGDGGNDPSDG